jgi:hypothetical protein
VQKISFSTSDLEVWRIEMSSALEDFLMISPSESGVLEVANVAKILVGHKKWTSQPHWTVTKTASWWQQLKLAPKKRY